MIPNFKNTYYAVGGSTTEVYSTVSNTYVAVADQSYQDWLAINPNGPNAAADEIDLWDIRQRTAPLPAWMFDGTTFVQPAVGQYSKANLRGYNANARYNHASGGVVVTSLSAVPFMSDPVSRNTLANADAYAKANPGHMTDWKLSDGSFIRLSEAQLATALNAMATFVQECFTCESTNLTAINGGAMTTLSAIDSAFAAISNVYP
jgi:hypothetical protein